MRENDECYKRPPMAPAAAVPAEPAATPEFVKQQQAVNKALLDQITKLSANVEKLLDASKDMIEQTEVAFKSVPSTAEMLTKIEDKLFSYSIVTTPAPVVIQPVDNSEFENKVLEKFDALKTGINELKKTPKAKEGLTIADKEFIHGLANETLGALENVKVNVLSSSDTGEQEIICQVYKVIFNFNFHMPLQHLPKRSHKFKIPSQILKMRLTTSQPL